MLVNVTIPVFNEEARLPAAIPRLHRFLCQNCRFQFEIVIADNGSCDRTLDTATSFARAYENTKVVHLNGKGRGGALKRVWTESAADVLTYMDVDLSTDLQAFPGLIQPLARGEADLAVGSRLLNPSLTTRGCKREFISR